MPTLRDLGEFEVLRRLAAARRPPAGTLLDAGDDAAILRPAAGSDLVVTTDAFVEGRHFLPDWFAASDVGARLAVANLSDLAAMAARPRWALLSMGVRSQHDVDELISLQENVAATLGRHNAGLVGGNLTAVEGAEWFSLALIGEAASGRAWTRSGARPGDLLAVSGWPGRAGAGARLAAALGVPEAGTESMVLLEAWFRPMDRVRFASALAEAGGVTAAIDISDGLSGDLARLCEASRVGAEILEATWPDALLEQAASRLGVRLAELRYGPSDDYELLLSVDPRARDAVATVASEQDVRLTFIGTFTDEPGILTARDRGGRSGALPASGYDHFGGS